MALAAGAIVLLALAAPTAASAGTAYVANQGTDNVTPIDLATNTAGTPIAVGDAPFWVAITPDGTTAYVTNRFSDNVTPIDLATNTAGTPITVGDMPSGIAITPDGTTAYVANQGTDNVTPIDTATNTAGTPITVGDNPQLIAITPDSGTAYVTNGGSDNVTPIDTATNTAGTPITVGDFPAGIAITPDGATAYVANANSDTVTRIDTATNTAGTPIAVGDLPVGVAITPDGATAYVADRNSDNVSPIDTATDTVGTAITVGDDPVGVAITPDGATAYVTNLTSNNVTPIDTATNTAGTAIAVGDGPSGIAITPMASGSLTERVSVDSAGNQGDSASFNPAISADGRYVAFLSHASNLVSGDANGQPDVFVRDRQTGTTERVSVDSAGDEADGPAVQFGEASAVAISADGQTVAFISQATNLVSGDTNGQTDVFVHDRQTGATERATVDSAGNQSNDSEFGTAVAISGDGRYVAFRSYRSDLVADDTNGSPCCNADIFVHDRQTGATERVNVDNSGGEAIDGDSAYPSISADGRFVAFFSCAPNLVAGDTNGTCDAFVHDRQTATTERVSVDSTGSEGNNASGITTAISGDGRYVAFGSGASNLVSGDANGVLDVFVHDRQTATTERVSVDSAGNEGDRRSLGVTISGDGRYVGFGSYASNLVSDDSTDSCIDFSDPENPQPRSCKDVFVHDRQTDSTERVSVDSAGNEGNNDSPALTTDPEAPAISADGRFVAFSSMASNLVADDSNGTFDVFVHERASADPLSFTVNTSDDHNDGGCTVSDCSLREAIERSNAGPGVDTISFDLPPGGRIISPDFELPTISDPAVIDGSSQPGFAGTPLVRVDGADAGAGATGLRVTAGSSTVRGLEMTGWDGAAIGLESGDGSTVEGNYIGTDGSTALANGEGVLIESTSSNSIIGGITAGAGNTISGNDTGVAIGGSGTQNNHLWGNRIGTNAAGTAAVANGTGVFIYGGATYNALGANAAGSGNVISGNSAYAVEVTGSGTGNNSLLGNKIGTNAAGTAAVPNGEGVGFFSGASGNTVGGALAGDGNTISGNNTGIVIQTNANLVQGNRIGTNAAGTAAVGNTGAGVSISSGAANNAVGGVLANDGNTISGNNTGVSIGGAGTNSNLVASNRIGTNTAGTAAVANGTGIHISGGAANNAVGGSAAGAGNVISGNSAYAVDVSGTGTTGNVVQGNRIGTNAAATGGLTNGEGVGIFNGASGNLVGGTTAGAGNVISRNHDGIVIADAGTNANVVQGNRIGTDAAGTGSLGNTVAGVDIEGGATNNRIGGTVPGAGNTIANNGSNGVRVLGAATTGNSILSNSIFTNGNLGIELSSGGNANLAAPTVATVAPFGPTKTVIKGSVNSASPRVEVFVNTSCADPEGRTLLGVATVSGRNWSLTISRLPTGRGVTATVTNSVSGNTSRFSNCKSS